MRKRLPIGVSDFKEMIVGNYYYVDKSLLIKEIVDNSAKVVLFPRPRRFGKTLNISMLRYFFEKTSVDHSLLFEELNIARAGEKYTSHQGIYPMIYLTFKDIKDGDWSSTYQKIQRTIIEEYERHYQLFKNQLTRLESDFCESIITLQATQNAFEDSLKYLSRFLERATQTKVMILIDEYDTPIQCGYINGYYQEIVGFMRNFLGGGLKDNIALEKGILTGILRIAKESIFSGLNNLNAYSLLNHQFDTQFGLLGDEVEQFLRDYQLAERFGEVKQWYNGYKFGRETIYNPWSIIKYIESGGIATPYWVNTSSNDLVRKIITESGIGFKKDLAILIEGGSIEKQVYEDITFGEIENSNKTIWSFLLFSGYLRVTSERWDNGRLYCNLSIPNFEVRYIYEEIIINWFENSICDEELEYMLKALINGDLYTFGSIFEKLVQSALSYFDTGGNQPENFYHAFVLGLLVHLRKEYQVKSNRESGYGRYDVMLLPYDLNRPGIVLEFKRAGTESELEMAVETALKQIAQNEYKQELCDLGIKHVIEVGLAFFGKKVLVRGKVN